MRLKQETLTRTSNKPLWLVRRFRWDIFCLLDISKQVVGDLSHINGSPNIRENKRRMLPTALPENRFRNRLRFPYTFHWNWSEMVRLKFISRLILSADTVGWYSLVITSMFESRKVLLFETFATPKFTFQFATSLWEFFYFETLWWFHNMRSIIWDP